MPRPCECRACRVCRVYESDPGYRRLFDGAPVPAGAGTRRRTLPCRNLGDVVQRCHRNDEFLDTHECEAGRGLVTRAGVCEFCPPEPGGYEPVATPAASGPGVERDLEAIPAAATPGNADSAGVVVGVYGLPLLAELQVRLLRATNAPDLPILIADDGSPDADALEALGARHGGVTVWVSPSRRGHYAGDLSVFWKGLCWARSLGLRHLAKVSQRCLIDRPGWLTAACGLLAGSGHALAGQRCIDNRTDLFVRTEACVLDVARWSAPEVLRLLDSDRLGNPTELHVNHVLRVVLGSGLAELPWLSVNRYARSEGVVWHGSHAAHEFREVAARFGLGLDAGFTTDGWQYVPGWVRG